MLATSALSPGEKIWFKNRTLLDYLPLAIFPRYSAKTNEFQLAKVLLESTHSGYNLDGDSVSCLHHRESPVDTGLLLNLISWEEVVSRVS